MEGKAARLGIDLDVFMQAGNDLHAAMYRHRHEDYCVGYVNALKELPDDELVAMVRWHNLHKCYPEEFDWNGRKDS